MAENKKISQLNPAVAFTGAEKFEILQGGLNLCGTPEQMKEYVGAGPTRESNRASSSELLFDKNIIQMDTIVQSGPLNITISDTGNLDGQESVIITKIQSDGESPITVQADFFSNFTQGEILDAGTYKVFVLKDLEGEITFSVVKPAYEVQQLTPLSTPTNLAFVPDASSGDTELDGTWDAVSGATAYEFQYSTSGGSGPWLPSTPTVLGTNSHTMTGLNPGTTYHQRVRAVGDGSATTYSNWVTTAATTENTGDSAAPVATFDPADSETDVPVNGALVITMDEAIRNTDGSEITNANVASLITLKVTDGAGADIDFIATIDTAKTVITIVPDVIYPIEDDVFAELAVVEDVNGNEASAQSATFTTSDFSIANGNLLYFGNILNSLFAANDAKFKLQHTIKETVLVGERTLFRKHDLPSQPGWLWYYNNNDVYFGFTGPLVHTSFPNQRLIKWENALATNVEQTLRMEYDGSIDTNNGLDRLKLFIDNVEITSGKTLATALGTDWPFNINSSTSQLRSGPGFSQIKDTIILSDGDVVELNVPISRSGLDISGNDRHGTWV